MAGVPTVTPESSGHGDVFGAKLGAMIIHVQRENGLAHRTIVLRPWQVRVVRVLSMRTTQLALTMVLLSWVYFAIQAARIPLLVRRVAQMEQDAVRLDTLQRTIDDLQARYDQVQAMLSRPATPELQKRPR